jgi:hypothetical protein
MHHLITIPAMIIGLTMSLGVAPAIADSDYNPREECSDKNWENFGINCDGWNITIDNDNATDIVFYEAPSSGVHSSPERITSFTTNAGNTHGKESWLGGPADTRLYYTSSDLPDGGRFIDVTADFSGNTNIVCGTWEYYAPYHTMRYIYEYPSTRCAVTAPSNNSPIVVRFT